MNKESSDAKVTALVAQSLRERKPKATSFGLRDDDASERRKRIIELMGLPRPKTITPYADKEIS
jgi:hypothetical protein